MLYQVNNVILCTGVANLEVSSDRPPTYVNKFGHVIISIKSPDAALQIEMLVQLDGSGLTDVGVELVRPIIARTQRYAVIGHIIQEACF